METTLEIVDDELAVIGDTPIPCDPAGIAT
jgi:hypothetical protein